MSYLFTAPMKHYTPAEANRSSDPEQSESWRGLVETTFAVAAIVLLAVFALKMAELLRSSSASQTNPQIVETDVLDKMH